MKTLLRRTLSLLLVLVMAASMLPVVYAQETTGVPEEPVVLTDEDYASADALFAQIDAMEESPAKKNASETELADAAAALVMASDSYVEGSLERNGNSFTWWTTEGIRCVYSPRMREIEKEMVAPANPIADGAYNEPAATKGGWPSGNQVYLIAPYYGYDDSFTDQYKNEAKSIASAIGDTDGYTLYSGKAATIDTVAQAMSNGAVVIFDSHGNTDYESGNDYVTGANYSYLCMKSTSGLTDEDYDDGALYYSDGIWITGASIANHMTKQSPAGLLWMAICLGMATDTFATPMREMGVEVVYGYSQSVTFAGDYLYEETFWDSMCAGDNVATAIAAMKAKWGNWDWSTQIATEYNYTDGYATISAARADYAAFPIVVSDEDTHPGQRKGSSFYGADSLQTVKSTYTLYSQYNVTATSNNTSYGTVSINGNTITATPATGYFAQSATVLSGSATVNQNGNTFSVIAQSDCTVQINFAPKTPVTVSFSGATVAAQNGYAGDSMTLPTATAPEGYKFIGWMTSPLNADTTEKPSFLTGSFVPTGNTTLYALYSYVDENTGTGTGDYVKVTEDPGDWTGEYLIVYEDSGYIFDGSLTTFDAVSNYQTVTISDNTISADQGDAYKFTIASMDNGYSIQGISGGYIGQGGNTNGLTTGTSALANTIGLDASGNANIVSAGGAYLRFNDTSGQYRFRYYKSSTYSSQKPVALYLKDGTGGTTYFTGTPYVCEHTNTQNVDAVAATCTESGYTAGVQCVDCNTYISGHEVIPATGHSYNGVVTAPTITEQGYTTYTCSVCGDSYVGDYVDALGETFYVSFSVPAGVSAVETMACGKAGITLPTAGALEGYTFEGWTTAPVDNATTRPTVLTGSYTATSNVTLYALYSYTEGGTVGGGAYTLVTDASTLSAGAKVVIASNANGYVAGALSGKYLTHLATSFSSDLTTITTLPAGAIEFTLGGSANSWTLTDADGNLLGATANKSLSFSGGTTTWTISVSGNDATIASTNTTYGRILYNVGSPRFLNYTSATSTSMLLPQLYMMSGSAGTTYYTTDTTVCEHANTTNMAAVAANCTESGFTAGVYCNDCETYISGHEVVDALGHNWSSWTVTTEPGCETAGQQTHTCSACNATETQTVDATGHDYNSVVTAPTETEQGYTTHTCANCGDSYVDSYTPALGVSYTVSFSIPAGVASVGSMTGNSSGITLPTAGAPEGYTFEGWSAVTVQETTTVPTILTGNYVPTANTTLYAVYSREETVGGGSTEYVLTDIADISATDEVVVTMASGGTVYALPNNGGTSTPTAAAVDVSDNKLSSTPADTLLWNIGGSAGAYIFYPNGTTTSWLYCTNDSKGVKIGNTTDTFSIDSTGYLKSASANRYMGVYNGATWRCYTSASTNIGGQTLGFYVKTGGSTTTTYYTTVFEAVGAAVMAGGQQVNVYATVAEAVAACGEGQYVKLLNDVEADLALTKDLYIDLNGHILFGDITGDFTVYGMDCATNEYKLSEGYIVGDISNVQIHVLTDEAMTGDIYRYMAIEDENGWSFNRYYVGITHTSLNTAKVGLGYKAAVFGNLHILLAVDSFSYTLQLGDNRAITRTMDGINDDGVVTLLVKNYMIEQYGEMDLSAYVTVTLDGEAITSAVQTTSFRKTVELINDNYTSFSADQLSAVRELILANEVMQNWNVANLLKEETDVDPAMVAIVNAAYALASGESMTTTSTLTGVITKVDTAYSSGYGNISVTIAVAGAEDKPILCYRMKGEGADQITVGDTITVTGTLKNYNGTIEFDAGCSLDSWVHTGEDVDKLTDPVEIVNAAYALAVGASLPYEVTLTGTIIRVDTEYSADYGNVTVTITVAGVEDKPIVCFRLKGTGADSIAVGDTITVTGTLMNYNGTIEFGSGCTLG